MKILFDNAAKRATISSVNELVAYPAENLVSQFLEERWQENFSDPPTAVITVTFDNPEDIDCLFFAYTNLTGIYAVTNSGVGAYTALNGIEMTSDGYAIVTSDGYAIGMNEAPLASDALYWSSTQEGVTSLTIYLFGDSNPLYLGGIGVGKCVQMPDPVNNPTEGREDNSVSVGSAFGQSLSNRIDPLKADSYSFRNVTRAKTAEVFAGYDIVGLGGKVWVDWTERNHAFKAPMYARVTAVPASTKDGRRYNFGLNFTEAR